MQLWTFKSEKSAVDNVQNSTIENVQKGAIVNDEENCEKTVNVAAVKAEISAIVNF